MKTILLLAAFLGASLAAGPARAAEKLALLPVTGTNIHPGYLEAATDILKDHLLSTGKFLVVTVAGQPGAAEANLDQALAKGREAGAALVVTTHLARLSGTGRLRLTAYRVSTGSVTHSDSLGIAGGPDDLDPALKRLAAGLATGKPVAQTGEIDSVTQREADPYLKQTATKTVGLRLGTLFAFNRPPTSDTGTLPGIGVFWMYDARSFIADIGLDLFSADDGTAFSVGIGGYFPFSRENFTPYVGAGVAYAFVNEFGGQGGRGLRLAPTAGVLFGRLSTVQIRGEVGYFINTFGEREEPSASGAIPSDRRYAHGPQILIGIGF